jgi:hypothetical protein
MTTRLPSAAQAKRIAVIWASASPFVRLAMAMPGGPEPYQTPTTHALVKHGWLVSLGEETDRKETDNPAYRYVRHILSPTALPALAAYLAKVTKP